MSGGTWNYKQYNIEDIAQQLTENRLEIAEIIKTAARTEHEIDWAEACDTSKDDAAHRVYDLWRDTFNRLYDNS